MQSTQAIKILLAPILVLAFVLVGVIIWLTKPEASRRPPPPANEIQVAVQTLEAQDLPVSISSYGLVEPLTQSTLVARVNGVIEFVAESFREGGRFAEGEVLVRLDRSDYEIELQVAKGQVAEAESRYTNELALASEARASWASSGRTQEPPPLAVREPQVAAAKAALQSAQASAERAALNLRRTEIIAPYDGQVLEQMVDLGQLVSPNAPLARVFSSEAAIIKLPVKSRDLPLLNLADLNSEVDKAKGPRVLFTSSLGESSQWQGQVVRVASAINNESRQLHLIAKIPKPFSTQEDGREALKIGEYLRADIIGRTLQGVIAVPNSAIYQNSYAYTFADQQVQRRALDIRWSNDSLSIIDSGLNAGDRLVLTPLGQVPSGTAANIIGSAQQVGKRREGKGPAKAAAP